MHIQLNLRKIKMLLDIFIKTVKFTKTLIKKVILHC